MALFLANSVYLCNTTSIILTLILVDNCEFLFREPTDAEKAMMPKILNILDECSLTEPTLANDAAALAIARHVAEKRNQQTLVAIGGITAWLNLDRGLIFQLKEQRTYIELFYFPTNATPPAVDVAAVLAIVKQHIDQNNNGNGIDNIYDALNAKYGKKWCVFFGEEDKMVLQSSFQRQNEVSYIKAGKLWVAFQYKE